MKGLLTSQEQDGWREVISKEVFCRIRWKAKYGRKYPQRLPDPGISRQKCSLPDIDLSKEDSSSRNRDAAPQKEPAEEKVGLSLQEPLPEMRVPTPETTQLLYKGFSHEGKGRQQYLKERMMKSPEEKFCYPVLSSWEYGWRLGDTIKDIRTPVHGKSCIVKDTFYFKNGTFYTPSKTDQLA
ncbi:protein SPMIP1 [Erythrolamprus reginae]|uniref:protein SPMIP1 n=1 Tax=Erythrolamprus reginae TaxID=121349 RepID=UPI00396C5723